jgi:ABC-type branched-subunit amino acid transport system substrate-binding protein
MTRMSMTASLRATRRNALCASAIVAGAVAMAAASGWSDSARAQEEGPIKIGFSMALTGGLAGAGKPALLGMEIWRDDINAKGGLLGRPVEFVYYDDQTQPANVPKIYTKLLTVDDVDLVVSGYGTNLTAPAMPIIMREGMVFMSLFALGANEQFNYDRYFQIMPAGPEPKEDWSRPFIKLATDHGLQTIALVLRSSTTNPIRPTPRISRRSSGPSRRPIPTSCSSARTRLTRPAWCGLRTSLACRRNCSAAAWSVCSMRAC